MEKIILSFLLPFSLFFKSPYVQLEKHTPLTIASIALSLCNNNDNNFSKIRSYIGFIDEMASSFQHVSPKTEATIKAILKEINYNRPLQIKRLHAIGRFFKGKQNIYITSSHSLIVSEEWFNTLSYEEQKFIIAQRVIQLEEYHYIYRLIIDTLSGSFWYRNNPSTRYSNKVINRESSSFDLHIFFMGLMAPTLIRLLSTEADGLALERVKTNKGAIKFFKKRVIYKNDGRFLSSLQMLREQIRDFIHQTPLYYISRNNQLNSDRLDQARQFEFESTQSTIVER